MERHIRKVSYIKKTGELAEADAYKRHMKSISEKTTLPDTNKRRNLPLLINEIKEKEGVPLDEAIKILIKSDEFKKDFDYFINADGITEEIIIESLKSRYKAMITDKLEIEK